jgi:hypothetical protein
LTFVAIYAMTTVDSGWSAAVSLFPSFLKVLLGGNRQILVNLAVTSGNHSVPGENPANR